MPPLIFVRVAASMAYERFYERCGTCARGLANGALLVRRSDRAPCALLARAFEITRAGSGAAIVRGRDARCRRKRSNIWSTKAGAARPLYRYLGTPTPAGRGRRLPPNATAAKERTRVCILRMEAAQVVCVHRCSAGHRLVAQPDVRQVAPRLADRRVELQRQRAPDRPILVLEVRHGPRQSLNIHFFAVARHLRM